MERRTHGHGGFLMGPRYLLAALVLLSCGTLGGAGDEAALLPSSGVGPFRILQASELSTSSIPPYVFSDPTADYREPTVVGVTSDPASTEVWMYAVARVGGADVIVRTRADDARSFYGDAADNADTSHAPHVPPTVLKADEGWEGGAAGSLAGPSALRVDGQLWLYYAATPAGGGGGIGLARSSDGLTFTKESAPVLGPDPGASWETTTPHAPSVAIFPDGSWHMMYGAGASIGEATSSDGLTWTRVDGNPILLPSPGVDAASLAPGELPPFDEGQVDDPVIAPQTTIDGRLQVRVLYSGYALPPGAPGTTTRASAIGFAARFGDSGSLSRQVNPVYTEKLHENAPAFFEWSGGSLLYVSEDDPALSAKNPFPAIACGYAPATRVLPPPAAFPASP